MPNPQHFIFALVEDFTHLAFSCAVDPLRIANLISGKELYRWSYASENGKTATSSDGTTLLVHHAFNALPGYERLFVLSGINMHNMDHRVLLTALRNADRHNRGQIGALCSGAYILAKGGFLNGKRAAIHWEYHDAIMEEYPEVVLQRNVFVADSHHVTAAGGTATADLMLHLIAEDHGSDLSMAVADQMVYSSVRDGSSDQTISLQARNGMRNRHLARAVEIMRNNIEFPHPPSAIAAELGISLRQMERLFGKYLNSSPKKFYVDLRIEKARNLLIQTEMSITEVSFACGFESLGTFSRVYRSNYGITPMMQRGKFDRPT
ncbi:GlxA family transcriptional regulator [Epibacterium ulvae]|uniref:GlxA family transcriptional regulator n=1 Tax=Epibacterium ulvae TaxID=1156985 RepID=UPI002493BCDB|nr:GlxA family transcriptional regulator [Epibacterium ulvae]